MSVVNKDSLVESILRENISSCVIPTGYLFYTFFKENCNIIISWLLTSEQCWKNLYVCEIALKIISENVNIWKSSLFLPHRVQCPVTFANLTGYSSIRGTIWYLKYGGIITLKQL